MRTIVAAGLIGVFACAQGAAAACLTNGQPITGTLKWMSLTAPRGKPIPAPFLILAAPACAVGPAGNEVRGTRVQLMLAGVDPLKGVHEGDTLTIIGDYGPPEAAFQSGDIVAVHARIVAP